MVLRPYRRDSHQNGIIFFQLEFVFFSDILDLHHIHISARVSVEICQGKSRQNERTSEKVPGKNSLSVIGRLHVFVHENLCKNSYKIMIYNLETKT